MDKEIIHKIETLASDAFDKRMHYERLSKIEPPNEEELLKAAYIEYAMSMHEMIKARTALEDAIIEPMLKQGDIFQTINERYKVLSQWIFGASESDP